MCRSPEASTAGSTGGADSSYGASYGDHEDHPSLRSSGFHPYDDRRSPRRRTDYYGAGHGGGVDTTVTHLDDHAEQLWLNSPAIRAAASAAAAAAAEAAEESLGSPDAGGAAPPGAGQQQVSPVPATDDGAPSSGLASGPEHREGEGVEGQECTPPVGGIDSNEQGEGFDSDDEILGGESETADSPTAPGLPPSLRTHTDLGDLELAAEKALDLLRDEGADILDDSGGSSSSSGGGDLGGGGGGDSGGGSSSAGESRSSAGESRGSGDGAEGVSPSPDAPTGHAGSGGARASGRSGGVPPQGEYNDVAVRLRTGSSMEGSDTAALAVRGLSAPPGHGARGRASGQEEQQPERRPTARSAKTAARIKEKEKATTPSKAASDGEGNAPPTTPQASRAAAPSPDGAAPPLPSGEGVGGSGGGGAGRRRHSTSFVAVAARAVSPAVCRIDTMRLAGTPGESLGDVVTGQGSGLIFSSEDGLVLTNAHVVAGARKVRYSVYALHFGALRLLPRRCLRAVQQKVNPIIFPSSMLGVVPEASNPACVCGLPCPFVAEASNNKTTNTKRHDLVLLHK